MQPQIDYEEHTTISGIAGKKVYVMDTSGNVINSFGSLATVSIGSSATLYAVVNADTFTSTATITLNTGTAQIGSVTVSNPITLGSNVTLNASNAYIGLVTVANTVPVTGTFWQDNQTVSGTVAATQSGTWDEVGINDSGNSITVDGTVSLGAGTAYVGLASVNIGGTLPALTASSAYIGLVTVASTVQLRAGTAAIGFATVRIGSGTQYIGLASVNIGGTLPALVAGTAYVGLASVNIGGTLPALAAGTAQIGSVTIANQQPLVAGTAWIGFATTAVASSATLYAVVNTAATSGLATINVNTGAAWIGLATTTIGSAPTLYAVVNTSAAGTVDVTSSSGVTVFQGVANWDIRDLTSVSDSVEAVQGTAADLNMTEANSGSIKTAVEVIDNIVSGSEAQVDVVAALPTGANFIGLATVVPAVPTSIVHGMVSAASGALVQLENNTVRWLSVRASIANPTTCYIGGSLATVNNGFPLDPGDALGIDISNSNLLYLVGVGTTEVRFLGGL